MFLMQILHHAVQRVGRRDTQKEFSVSEGRANFRCCSLMRGLLLHSLIPSKFLTISFRSQGESRGRKGHCSKAKEKNQYLTIKIKTPTNYRFGSQHL